MEYEMNMNNLLDDIQLKQSLPILIKQWNECLKITEIW